MEAANMPQNIIALLGKYPKGMGIRQIAKELHVEVRDIRGSLRQLQNNMKITSGFVKFEDRKPKCFIRHYYLVADRR